MTDSARTREHLARADQTRRIVEALDENAKWAVTDTAEHFNRALARLIEREFGTQPPSSIASAGGARAMKEKR